MSDFNRDHDEYDAPKFGGTDSDSPDIDEKEADGDAVETSTAPRIQPSAKVSFEQALDILEKGVIDTEYGILRWSSNYAFLICVEHNGLKMNAVYKPQRGERPLWDFPDGTLCYRELASFLTSCELGWLIVPPTVLREGSRGIGSVQMFIEHDPQVNYFSFNEEPGALAPQLMRMAAFDAIVNNADRKGGHCLLDMQDHLWGIDHGITFHSAHKLRTVIWDYAGKPIPDALLADVDRLCCTLEDPTTRYRQQLQNLLSAIEIKAFQNRIRTLLKLRRYPLPGAGPNYPWPPV
ncbi:MAG: SCO1664 family protein [bacterium]|nr:SCO1664 family protein [bacterium]